MGFQHWSSRSPLPALCPPASSCPAPSWGSLSKGSLHVLPSVCFQGNVAGTPAGAAVEIWQLVPCQAAIPVAAAHPLLRPQVRAGAAPRAVPWEWSCNPAYLRRAGGKADAIRSKQTPKYVCYPQLHLNKSSKSNQEQRRRLVAGMCLEFQQQ